MTIVGKIRAISMLSEIHRRLEFYSAPHTREEQLEIQLLKFNAIWQGIFANIPYYQEKVISGALPREFRDWDQFYEIMPISARQDYQKDLSNRCEMERNPNFFRVTGGSTGEPIRIPAWEQEHRFTRADMWSGRALNGIQPEDRCVFFWGNQVGYDPGVSARSKRVLRNLKDYLLGYCRVSPYALTRDEGFRSIVPELVRFKPRYLIGYTSIVERLAYANRSTPDLLQGLALKGVIVSSDGFISPNGRRVVEEVFGCPVILEYGSIETDVMAYTNLAGHFQVFWQNHFLEVLPGQDGESGELLVTDLFPRCCPLVRYRIGDEIILCQEDTGLQYGLTRFQAVRGRMHDFVLMPDGQRIYAYLFYTVLKEFSEVVTRVQIVQLIDGVAIDVQSPLETIPDGILGEMHRRLRNLNPLLANIDIRVVKQLHQTARGKTPSVWLESPPTT